jgi:hypothetical protein
LAAAASLTADLYFGLHEGLRARAYKLPRANSSRSAGGSIFTFGPTRGIARKSLQAAVGQLEPIGRQQHIYVWAHARGYTKKDHKLLWANSS